MSSYSDPSGANDKTIEQTLDHGVLERYWCGEASPDEVVRIEAWFASHPREQLWYEQLRDEIRATGKPLRSPDSRRVRTDAILNAIGSSNNAVGSQHPLRSDTLPASVAHAAIRDCMKHGLVRRRFHALSPFSSLAAVALIIISAAIGWGVNAYRVGNTLAEQSSLYSTENGERATIRLPDGTVVILNVASRLMVPGDYATGNRVVQLEGEAIFTVEHATKHPFTVKAGPSTTRVLGTSFVVRHYADDSVAQVAVRDGKVAVGDVIVTAAQRVSVTAQGVGGIQRVVSENQFSFERGVLYLQQMPLHNAIRELNRWYDADIRLDDPTLGRAMIGGQFSSGSVLELMEQLTVGLNVEIHRNGRVVTLNRRGA